jgi:uncharacterized protein
MLLMIQIATVMASISSAQIVAKPFELGEVKLTGGPFLHAESKTAAYLLELDTDRLLAGFRANAGIKSNAKNYGGWETGGLSGHSLGHYLTACAQEYSRTKDRRYKQKADAIVKGLKECQVARKDGFICAFRFDKGFDPERLNKIWNEVSRGELRSGGFDLNGMWSPWYVHHKLFAGLLDAHLAFENVDAIEIAKKFGEWAINITKNLTPEQWQTMLGTEYGGMNDSLAELYSRTKDPRFLELARKFYDNRVLAPLSKNEDNLSGKHSNTQIPKIIGLAKLYELDSKQSDRSTAEFFWDRVVNHHSYVVGGNSNGEYLGPPDKLNDRLTSNTCETCNTYNMLKLTRHLFSWNPKASLMDYYERAYYNHILASQDPDTGMVTYFLPLGMGSKRNYSNKFDDFTCCHGSGMENHTKHGDSIYFHQGTERLWVNLFVPSELNWKEAGVSIVQKTAFPLENRVSLTVSCGKSKKFDLRLRKPAWIDEQIKFKLNGKQIDSKVDQDGYFSFNRTWKDQDRIEFELPTKLRIEAMPDNANRVAVLYGPIVLAAVIPQDESAIVPRSPVFVAENREITKWLKPIAGKPLQFETNEVTKPYPLRFSPFFQMHHEKHGVYFDIFTSAEWSAKESEYRTEENRIRDLESRTIDFMVIGEMQPERDHNLASEKNDVREVNGRSFRTPMNNGWFEFDLKCDPSNATELVLTYWGNDLGSASAEISVDGVHIETTNFSTKPKNRFFDLNYVLPKEVTNAKEKIRIRIAASKGQRGPSVSGARLVKQKASMN